MMNDKHDPLAQLRAYLANGHSVYDLAEASGVPRRTIQNWLERGVPKAVRAWHLVTAIITVPPTITIPANHGLQAGDRIRMTFGAGKAVVSVTKAKRKKR